MLGSKATAKRKSTHQRKLPQTDYGEPPIAVVDVVAAVAAAAVSSLPPPARVWSTTTTNLQCAQALATRSAQPVGSSN